MSDTCIFWFRKDLRLDDNPALLKAIKHKNVIPLFIFDPSLKEYAKIGGASLWWLEKSLISLNKQLNGKLRILFGHSNNLIFNICNEKNIKFVYWNRCYEPDRIIADTQIKAKLIDNNIKAESFNASLLWEPWNIKNKSGNFYKVFTPFYNRGCLEADKPRTPLEAVKKNNFIKLERKLTDYKFSYEESKNKWYKKLEKYWNPSESNALSSFEDFLKNSSDEYAEGRNFPSKKNVSRISAYLHWGQISPFRLWHDAKKNMKGLSLETFLSELGWREFSYHLLYYFPDINNKNLKPKFNNLEWNNDNNLLDKWKKGKTGYPIVDAGMRELWQTGYMHNRLRMITASFLIKNLLIHWKFGEQWFWDCLVDADLASNSASWQWVAGTGSDAAPFFRIFNPMTQAQKFDKEGTYIRKFLPEIAKLPNKFIFNPWLADKQTLKDSNVELGINYPLPIIDYTLSRSRALEAFKKI
ncbi:DNA photolyase family protein [Alphaproteobacteria bacterium]|nr:DNA photolyase family protein [Alphaproteobacteria bacterium]